MTPKPLNLHPHEFRALTIHPVGEIGKWTFETGHYCGEAKDSVGISIPHRRKDNTLMYVGCVLKREDVISLRKFLETAEKEWNPNPKSISEIFKVKEE